VHQGLPILHFYAMLVPTPASGV